MDPATFPRAQQAIKLPILKINTVAVNNIEATFALLDRPYQFFCYNSHNV